MNNNDIIDPLVVDTVWHTITVLDFPTATVYVAYDNDNRNNAKAVFDQFNDPSNGVIAMWETHTQYR
jgi:hypothetical protein